MAQRGQLPGAAKIGKVWTFDPAKLRRFIEEKEAECQKRAFPIRRAQGSSARMPTTLQIEKAYERAMAELRGKGATRAPGQSGRKLRTSDREGR
jgi:hypothetical protein